MLKSQPSIKTTLYHLVHTAYYYATFQINHYVIGIYWKIG